MDLMQIGLAGLLTSLFISSCGGKNTVIVSAYFLPKNKNLIFFLIISFSRQSFQAYIHQTDKLQVQVCSNIPCRGG
jgi:hypothetical protein